jgi:hypothetical protein
MLEPGTIDAIISNSSTVAIQTTRRWTILLSSLSWTRIISGTFAEAQPFALQGNLERVPGCFPSFLVGQIIQPALYHTEYTPEAHSCAKETSRLCT